MLRFASKRRSGRYKVNPGSKAAEAGLREGDVISELNDKETYVMTNNEAQIITNTANRLNIKVSKPSQISGNNQKKRKKILSNSLPKLTNKDRRPRLPQITNEPDLPASTSSAEPKLDDSTTKAQIKGLKSEGKPNNELTRSKSLDEGDHLHSISTKDPREKEPLKPDVPPSSSSWPVRSRSSDRAASSSLIRSRRSLFSAAEEQENRARAQRVLALKPAFARGSQSDDLGETSQRSISRSSFSSRESSQESLDSVSTGNAPWASAPSDGSRSRSLSRRSKSILQKAKIWEAVDERPEESGLSANNNHHNNNSSNFATLPWSTKFDRDANRKLSSRDPLRNVMQKTCSSPSIFDMVQKPVQVSESHLTDRDDELKNEKRLSLPPVSETDAIFSQIAGLAYLDEAAEVSRRPKEQEEEEEDAATEVKPPEIDISLNRESEVNRGPVSSDSSESTTVIEKGKRPNEKVEVEEEEEEIEAKEGSVNRQDQSGDDDEEADTEDALERSLSSTARELSAILTSRTKEEVDDEDTEMPSSSISPRDTKVAANEEEKKVVYEAEQSYFEENLSPLVSFPLEAEGINMQPLMSVVELTEQQQESGLERNVIIAKDVTEPENSSPDKIPNFVLIREISLDPARTFDRSQVATAPIVPEIRIELCDDENDFGNNEMCSSSEFDQEELTSNVSTEDDYAIIDNEGINSSSCTPPEDVIEGSSAEREHKDRIFLTVPEDDDYFADQVEDDDDNNNEELQDDDLELVEVSENGSSVCEDDDEETTAQEDEEYESLRMRRMRSQRSVLAPERDVSEDDTETAEFQTRLRKLSNTSLPSSGNFPFGPPLNLSRFSGSPSASPISVATPTPSPEPEKPAPPPAYECKVDEAADESALECSRGRESEAPEREIETEDKESAELQTNLRRSRSSEIFLRRKNSKKLIKRNSCNLEVLDEGTVVNTLVETVASAAEGDKAQEQVVVVGGDSGSNNSSSSSEDCESPPRRRQRLFKSLSAGSDLDKLKLISEQSGGKIHSLVNLVKSLESPGEIRRKSGLKPPSNPSPTPSSCQTSSVQSINKLADSVENLREKLTMHSGIFFPMTKKEQEMEDLLAQTNANALPIKPPTPDCVGLPSPNGKKMIKLSRSHSWQGFGSTEFKRQVRQQAFWSSDRYEQVTDSDLKLPPPPSNPPPAKHAKSLPNSPLVSNKNRRSRNSLKGGSSRRYRPLSGSPKRRNNSRLSDTSNSLEESLSEDDFEEDAKAINKSDILCESTLEVKIEDGSKNDICTQRQVSPNGPTVDEVQQFVDYLGEEILNKGKSIDEDELELDNNNDTAPREYDADVEEDDVEIAKRNKSLHHHRQPHSLSMIQEEEEESSDATVIKNISSNSRPGSQHLVPGYAGSVHQFGASRSGFQRREKASADNTEKRGSKRLSDILDNIPPPPPESESLSPSHSPSPPSKDPSPLAAAVILPPNGNGLQTAFTLSLSESPPKKDKFQSERPCLRHIGQSEEQSSPSPSPPPQVPIRTTSLRASTKSLAVSAAPKTVERRKKMLNRGKSLDEGMPDLVRDATMSTTKRSNGIFPFTQVREKIRSVIGPNRHNNNNVQKDRSRVGKFIRSTFSSRKANSVDELHEDDGGETAEKKTFVVLEDTEKH